MKHQEHLGFFNCTGVLLLSVIHAALPQLLTTIKKKKTQTLALSSEQIIHFINFTLVLIRHFLSSSTTRRKVAIFHSAKCFNEQTN